MKMIKGNQRSTISHVMTNATSNLFSVFGSGGYIKRQSIHHPEEDIDEEEVEEELIVEDEDEDEEDGEEDEEEEIEAELIGNEQEVELIEEEEINDAEEVVTYCCDVFGQNDFLPLGMKEEEVIEEDHRSIGSESGRMEPEEEDEDRSNLNSIIGLSNRPTNRNNGKTQKSMSINKERTRGKRPLSNGTTLGTVVPTVFAPTVGTTVTMEHDVDGIVRKRLAQRRRRKQTHRESHHHQQPLIDPSSHLMHNHYQQHWFSSGLERLKLEDRSRQERLEITRHELRRHLKQILRSDVGVLRRHRRTKQNQKQIQPENMPGFMKDESDDDDDDEDYVVDGDFEQNDYCYNKDVNNDGDDEDYTSGYNHKINNKQPYSYDRLVAGRQCAETSCGRRALPCTVYCLRHIMHNTDQVLFNCCTAKFADNRQCSQPVFDVVHDLPLCPEHARKRDNYKMYQETKPKKLRKKPSVTVVRPQKRTNSNSNGASSSKRKKSSMKQMMATMDHQEMMADEDEVDDEDPSRSLVVMDHSNDGLPVDVQEDSVELVEDMVEQVLALDVDHNLITQATTHLLEEEPDISNVLSTIPPDAFNDFFVTRNGDYEPTREETEELERALAAVDNDVKSLEKLSQSQELLDSLLDEQTLVDSLVQIPDMFHNGYAVLPHHCAATTTTTSAAATAGNIVIDNMMNHHHMVIGQTNNARLLQVEPNT